MTTTETALPAIPLQDLGEGLLKADFYAYEEILSDEQRETINRVRTFFRTRVVPIVDDGTARAGDPAPPTGLAYGLPMSVPFTSMLSRTA